MHIYFDVLNNSISFLKDQKIIFKQKYDYSLSNFENKLNAIHGLAEIVNANGLNKDKSNVLILPDDLIGFGKFDIPNISKKNEKDIFHTNFRLAFPNYKEYYVSSKELSRSDNTVSYLYAFTKIEYINKINEAFKSIGINITTEDTLNEILPGLRGSRSEFPQIYLMIGKYNSELFIVKGDSILSSNFFGFGDEALNSSSKYLYSAYNASNKEALSFSGFVRNNISSNKGADEEDILATNPEDGLKINEPKQMRLLKDDSLKQFYIKNNYKKFYSRIIDILNHYNVAPWFIPTNSINVVSGEQTYNKLLEVAKEDNLLSLEHNNPLNTVLLNPKISNNPLFSNVVKEERRKIDWKALLTKEIGKKKKA